MLDRELLEADIFAVRIACQPLVAGEQPDVDAELFEQVDRTPGDIGRQEVLLDRLQLRVDDRAAVERAKRQRQRQRLDQEIHADGGAAGHDGEADTRRAQPADRSPGCVGQTLVLGDQRAVDVGNDEPYAGHAGSSFSLLMMSSTMASTEPSIETVTAPSSGLGASSVLNWLSSSPAGMKWPLRAARRFAIMACVPSRKTMRTSSRPCTSTSR